MMAWQVLERGHPLPATEPSALLIGDAAAVAAGENAILARDSAFDPAVLTTFANQVFAAIVTVWSINGPAPVRGVVGDYLWEPLAAAAGANQSIQAITASWWTSASRSTPGWIQLATGPKRCDGWIPPIRRTAIMSLVGRL